MKARNLEWLAGGLVVAFLSSASAAEALPAATSQTQCTAASGVFGDPGVDDIEPAACSAGEQSASIVRSPVVTLHADALNSGLPGDAFASLTYDFEVVGGTQGAPAQVFITTDLTSSAGYPNFAFADLYTDGPGADAAVAQVCTDGSCPLGSSFDGTLSLMSAVGQVRQLTISIGAEQGFMTTGDAHASADPYIFVSPADAGLHSIEVSPGVGNAPPSGVPEPGGWAAMLLGLGVMGLVLRTRRRAQPTHSSMMGCFR